MLDLIKSSESTAVVIGVIKELDDNTSYAKFNGVITATVKGKRVIDKEEIPVLLIYNAPNYAFIDILWEDGGYKNYKSMGLYGRMSTQYQEVKKSGIRFFTLKNKDYTIDIMY